MNAQTFSTSTTPHITILKGTLRTTTINVAEVFKRNHRDVLRKVEQLDCSPEFNARNFTLVEYMDAKGEARPMYNITRDGFTFLAMGFTGKKAAQFKEAYIAAFNKMEQKLTAPKPPITEDLTYDEIVNRALTMSGAKIKAMTQERDNLAIQVKQLMPQSEALARIADTTGNLCITDAAKVIQIRPKQLFTWLYDNKWIYRRQGTGWLGFQSRLDQGVLQHKVVTVFAGGIPKVREQVLVTPKGLTQLATAFAVAEQVH